MIADVIVGAHVIVDVDLDVDSIVGVVDLSLTLVDRQTIRSGF